ncbi:MAG: hypothetical protein OHK0039_19780 [Bacteroidia bacterium]
MKKLYLLAMFLLTSALAWSQPTLKKPGFLIDTIFFRFDSHIIDETYRRQLDSMIGVFSAYPVYYLEIYGHTDSIGTDAYNLRLSEDRARAVALYLTDQGVDLSRITYVGLGTTKPAGSNDTYQGRSKNRRADVSVVFSGERIAPVYTVDSSAIVGPVIPEPPKADPVDTIYCSYNPFNINPARKTVIISPGGVHITVPANAFIMEEDVLTVEVKELNDRKEILLAEMPTLGRNGEPLEAQGMFSFEVQAGRRPPKLAEGVTFDIKLPATRRDDDMAVYEGSGGTRGGRRSSPVRKVFPAGTDGDPALDAVKAWGEINTDLNYKGSEKAYVFTVGKPGRYTVARPLYHSQNTDPGDDGIDIYVRFKGRRFERNTIAMVMGEVVKTYIPLKKVDIRNYEATKVKFLDGDTRLVLFAMQFDDKNNPYVAKLSFTPKQLVKKKKGGRPEIRIKLKFRPITPEDLNEMLTDLNV